MLWMVANLLTLAATVTIPEPKVAIRPTMKRFFTWRPFSRGNGIAKTTIFVSDLLIIKVSKRLGVVTYS